MDPMNNKVKLHSDDNSQNALASKSYWDLVYQGGSESEAASKSLSWRLLNRFPSALVRRFLADFVRTGGYPEYLFRKVLIEPHFTRRTDANLLEVGSAPGWRLVEMNRRLGYIPYGVEYSAPGVEINRRTFAANGLDPALVIHADFFSDEFQEKFHEHFDMVTSYGFIEHFSDAAVVVRKHLNVLKKGGRLLVVIPNLRGVQLLVTRFFSPEVVGQHNLDIMDGTAFEQLFEGLNIRPLFCGHIGVFHLALPDYHRAAWKRWLIKIGIPMSVGLGLLLRLMFRSRHPESKWLSPFLAFLGEKG
jgi:SAM-dependent methyltransferase